MGIDVEVCFCGGIRLVSVLKADLLRTRADWAITMTASLCDSMLQYQSPCCRAVDFIVIGTLRRPHPKIRELEKQTDSVSVVFVSVFLFVCLSVCFFPFLFNPDVILCG